MGEREGEGESDDYTLIHTDTHILYIDNYLYTYLVTYTCTAQWWGGGGGEGRTRVSERGIEE